MFGNRISGYFAVSSEALPPNPAADQQSSGCATVDPRPVIQTADLYQAARARAILDHELNKLFDPDRDAG